jgi:Cu/Ag efflux protein CusF
MAGRQKGWRCAAVRDCRKAAPAGASLLRHTVVLFHCTGGPSRARHTAMNRLHRRLAASLFGLFVAASAPLAWGQAATSAGEVTKLDKAAGKITLKSGEIKNLGMPPMTMAFRVQSPKMLDEVAVGDRVRFVAERIEGQYVVTVLSKAP